jgi:hypothetical protein
MSAQDKSFGVLPSISMGALTTTGANEMTRVVSPSALTIATLQRYKLTAVQGPAEIWWPLGIAWIVTTGITVTATVVQLLKNGVTPNGPSTTLTLNGIATLPIQATSAVSEFFAPFSDYTFAAAPAAGDAWSVKVITTSTAGAITARLVYSTATAVLGVTDGVLI